MKRNLIAAIARRLRPLAGRMPATTGRMPALPFRVIRNSSFVIVALCACAPLRKTFSAEPTDREAIAALYPKLVAPRDFTVDQSGTLDEWKLNDPRFPHPTAAQLAAAKITIASKAQQLTALRASLLSHFATLAPGEQAFYAPVFERVKFLLLIGDVNGAKQVIGTAPAPTEALAAARAAITALFP